MTSRGMKIALGASIALNLFLVGALVAGLVLGGKAFRERRGGPPLFIAAKALAPEDQARLKASMRAAAEQARADFRQAREARRRVVELARAPTYDKNATLEAMRVSRDAELRGRTRLDTAMAETLATFDQPAREKLAPALVRPPRGHRERYTGGRRSREDTPPRDQN